VTDDSALASTSDFWAVYDAHYDELQPAMQAEIVRRYPSLGPMMEALAQSPEAVAEQELSRELMGRAATHGDWEPYLRLLEEGGRRYAQMGLGFTVWFDVTAIFRPLLLPYLVETYGSDLDRLSGAFQGMDLVIDRALATIGESYLGTREDTIRRQHVAIQELSTPVLKVREGMLLLPIIGIVDSARSRTITEGLLAAVQTHRARVVVLDITGVPQVDTEVAHRLLQTGKAVALMGAVPILTGISAGVAQALVTVGVDLGDLRTLADLQSGIDEGAALLDRAPAPMGRDWGPG
jgi:anti-anti-sigma regulatory factor